MNNHEYRCQKCDYLFDDLMSPVADEIECPICGSEMLWIMGAEDNFKVDNKTSPRRSISDLIFKDYLPNLEETFRI